MKKKSLVIADSDELYLNNLANYFMEKDSKLELYTFSNRNKLLAYIYDMPNIDILLIEESFCAPEIEQSGKIQAKIIFSVSMSPVSGYGIVKKYQKTEHLYQDVMLKYAECTGTIESIEGISNTKVIAYYSPAGGTGKTTLALSCAAAAGISDMKVLYLNLEEIDSVTSLLPRTTGNLSDIFLAVKSNGANAGIKTLSCMGQEPNSGFYYLSGVGSVQEYEDVSGEEIRQMLNAVKALSDFHAIFVDCSSAFSECNRNVLEIADWIVCPVLSQEASIVKCHRWFAESRIHEFYNHILNKVVLAANQCSGQGIGMELQQSGLACVVAFGTAPVFASYKSILLSGAALQSAMKPLLEKVLA